jgi:hypothetical protein
MRLIREPVKPVLNSTRVETVHTWFDDSIDDRLKVAALQYLAICGLNEDIPLIRAEYEKNNYRTVGPATDALLRLTLKDSRDAAFELLNELQPERIDTKLVAELFSKPEAIETSLLVAVVKHRSAAVRIAAAPILVRRKEFAPELAEQLLTDTETSVRFHALQYLCDAGREYSDETLKSILIRPTASAGSLLGLAAWGTAVSVTDTVGEAFYRKIKDERLRGLADSALDRIIAAETIFDREARFARDYKHFRKRGGELRAALDDRFKTLFETDVQLIEIKFGVDSDTVKKLKSFEELLRKNFCRQALDIICEKSEAQDLSRVRAVLEEGFVEFSLSDVDYLRRHGEWRDVRLLISLFDRREQGVSLVGGGSDGKLSCISSALVAIGNKRLSELVRLTMPDRLREAIIERSSDKAVSVCRKKISTYFFECQRMDSGKARR